MSYFFKNLNFGIFHNLSLFFTSCIKEYNTQLANDKAAYDAANNISNLKACSKEMNECIESIKRKYDKQIVELSPDKKCQDDEPCELEKTDLNLLKSDMESALELMSKYNEQIAISTSHDASMKFYQFLINSAKCHPLKNFISRFFCKFCPAICLPH